MTAGTISIDGMTEPINAQGTNGVILCYKGNLAAPEVDWVRKLVSSSPPLVLGVGASLTGYFAVGGFMETLTPEGATAPLQSAGSFDAFIVKYDLAGQFQWARALRGSGDELLRGVSGENSSGDVYFTGEFGSPTLALTDADGGVVNRIGGSSIVLGSLQDSDGTLRLMKAAGGGGEFGVPLATDLLGSLLLAGTFVDTWASGEPDASAPALLSSGGMDALFARFDSTGAPQWARKAGGQGQELATGVAFGSDGSMYAGGYYSDQCTFGAGETQETTRASKGALDLFVARFAP